MAEVFPVMGLSAAIEQRRAARSFSGESIPTDTLAEIFRLGLRSPSGFNLQPWRFVVVRDAAQKKRCKSVPLASARLSKRLWC